VARFDPIPGISRLSKNGSGKKCKMKHRGFRTVADDSDRRERLVGLREKKRRSGKSIWNFNEAALASP